MVTVVTFAAAPPDARYLVHRLGSAWLGSGPARLALAPAVLNRLNQDRHEILHLHGDDWFFVRRKLPTVRTIYGSALFEARTATSLRRRVVQSCVYPLEAIASRLATLSFDIGSALPAGYRTDGSMALAVEDPVATSSLRSARPTVLFVGTWEGRKRGAFLAEEFSRHVLPRHPNAELVMVSDRCADMPGVRWVRFPSDAQLSELYGSAWLFCSPSTYEGFGMPYLEAMSHGLPVVATPNPGAHYVIGSHAGRLVPDVELGSTIADLLGDPVERRRLAAAGHEQALRFSWNRVIEEHEVAYKTALTRFSDGVTSRRSAVV